MQDLQPLLTLYTGSAAVALSAGLGAWRRRRDIPAARALAVVLFGLAWWATADVLQAVLPDGTARTVTLYAIYPGVAVVVAGFFFETRALVDRDWRPSRQTVVLVCIHPVLLQIVVATDHWHHLFIPSVVTGAGLAWLPHSLGPLFWLHTTYCYTVLAWCFVHLALGRRRAASPLHLRQLNAIVLAGLVPTLANAFTLSRPNADQLPDLTSCFFVVTGSIHYYAVFKLGLLRLLPVARGLVVEHVSDAIYVLDTTGRVIDLNPAGQRLARRLRPDLPTELVGLPARRLIPLSAGRRTLTDGHHQIEMPDGTIDLDLRISDLSDRRAGALGRVVVVRDVTQLNSQRRELAAVNDRLVEQLHTIDRLRHTLAEQAVRDELTGLHNRRHLMTQLEADLDRARTTGTRLALILLDIDHFKAVNDGFGHATGDHLLAATAHALAGSVRAGDTVARYGGEEFVVLLPDSSLEQGLATAEELRRRCAAVLVASHRGTISTTVSAGVAAFPHCGWTASALLQAADEAHYVAKAAGRDRDIAASA